MLGNATRTSNRSEPQHHYIRWLQYDHRFRFLERRAAVAIAAAFARLVAMDFLPDFPTLLRVGLEEVVGSINNAFI
jgi:hypothetical protein